jgi:protein-arginine kinase activator protein McsA
VALCKECGNEADELKTVKVAGKKKKKMCEDCADRLAEQGAIAEESEAVVQGMMGFKGRR